MLINTFKNKILPINIIFFAFLLFFSSCQTLKEQKPPAPTPPDETPIQTYTPKIGLFISDGGKGTFSLIPVLKFFQENQLHFDSIIGTGWGAWLGAIFAKNQNTDEIRWNLFKLQKKGVFENKLFTNKKKQGKVIESNIKRALSSGLSTRFICPALNKRGNLKWLGNRNPANAVLSCLNSLPQINFQFKNTNHWGSVFVAEQALEQLKTSGMDIIIWLKGPLQCIFTDQKQKKLHQSYQLELFHQIKKIKPQPYIFVFESSQFFYI